MAPAQPWEWTIEGAREELGAGRITIAAYVDSLLTRTERAEDLGALIGFNPEQLREAAAACPDAPRPLRGIPFARKDVFDVQGEPTSGGAQPLAEHVANATSPLIERLVDAGALLGPRTNLHELSVGVTSNNAAFGPVKNPIDPTRIAGGSSGGAAVAVAVGLAPFALGADTAGSVRIPAAYCGIVGFRPTPGRYSADGMLPLSPSRDTAGVFAKSVGDVRLVDGLLAATTRAQVPSPQGLRLAVVTNLVAASSEAVRASFGAAIERLRIAGIEIVEVDASELTRRAQAAGPRINLTDWPEALKQALGTDFDADALTAGIATPDVQRAWHVARKFASQREELAAALADAHAARQAWEALLAASDVPALLYPTSAIVAPPIGDDDLTTVDGEERDAFTAISGNAALAGILQMPALSLPIDPDANGLPIGLDLAGGPNDDARLLDVAAAVEAALQGSVSTGAAR